jgi:hypothetical protein
VEGSHKELDIELSRWNKRDNDVAQFVVQPYTRPGNIRRFALPPDADMSLHAFQWTAGRVRFTSEVGGMVIKDETFTAEIPAPDAENARINLWITDSSMQAKGDLQVVISRFEFAPERR